MHYEIIVRRLFVLGIICLMAIPTIFTTMSDAAIDTKNVVGVWLFDEVDGKEVMFYVAF